MRRTRWLVIAAAVLFAGCAQILQAPTILPDRHSLVLGQLVVHSDDPLPADHRLLAELTQQRDELATTLALPRSEEPIHVFLFNTPQQFSRFLSVQYPDFPERRAFFVETDTRLAVYAQWGDRVAEDLRHEVAHGYLHALVPNIPLWLDEGVAEYFEVPRGSDGLNRPHVIELTAALESGQWRPHLARLEQLTGVQEMTQRDYAESWAWVHLLLHTEPARRAYLCEYLGRLRATGAPEAFGPGLSRVMPEPERVLVEHLARVSRAE